MKFNIKRSQAKKLTAIVLSFFMILAMMPLTAVQSFATTIAVNDDGNDIIINQIFYVVNHDGFSADYARIQIMGTNLQDFDFLFDMSGDSFQTLDNKTRNTSGYVEYTLTPDEVNNFRGRIYAGNEIINLDVTNFPHLQSSDIETINIDDPLNHTIVFKGNNLTEINNGTVTGTYSNGASSLGTTTDDETLTLEVTSAPGAYGYQTIELGKDFDIIDADSGDTISVEINYTYTDVFRIIKDATLSDVSMFPNTGSKGDEVNFTGDGFTKSGSYEVYFLTSLDGSDSFSADNMATFVSLGIDVDGDEDKLIVKVPSGVDFELGNYYVVITEVNNSEIVAEHVVMYDDANYDQYTVVEATYKPTIESVYPDSGPDTSSNVQITGRNIISLNIPDLLSSGTVVTETTTPGSDGQELYLTYASGTYKGMAVDIERTVNVQIGKKTWFETADHNIQIQQKGVDYATTDSIYVITDTIDDAETDPYKDIVIEIVTTLTTSAGKKYIFNQSVTRTNGFEFEPSTYTPVINGVTPESIQVENDASGYMSFSENTQIAITGEKFLVDRFVDSAGNIVVQYPTVFIKKNDDNTFNDTYQLGVMPNLTVTEGGTTVTGVITYKESENSDSEPIVLTDGDGKPVQLNMVVLNDDNQIVDGTNGNQLGTKILITFPATTLIKDAGIKHVQVTNPVKDSFAYGTATLKSEVFEFVKTTDTPVIESVEPNIMTVGGGETVTITGSNFQEGIRLYLDGEEITSFSRVLDNTGTNFNIRFIAPEGREGTTKVQLVNPSGGIASADFTYVTSFNETPVITNFTPTMGSYDTLVVLNGDNFLKPDPTANSENGINAYRLLGTRVLMDNEEINSYNLDAYGDITFIDYTAPNEEALIFSDAGQAKFSDFYENTVAVMTKDENGSVVDTVVSLGNDAYDNPAVVTTDARYGFRYVSGNLMAYDEDGSMIGSVTQTFDADTGVTILAISGGPTFEVTMVNRLIHINKDTDGTKTAELADYYAAVILINDDDYYTLTYNFSKDIVLSNGKDKIYTIKLDDSDHIIAEDSMSNTYAVSLDDAGLTVDGTALTMKTAYTVDSNGNISGQRVVVLSKSQLLFKVPFLDTGRGYKDVTVVNPDTKSASFVDEEGFYYVTQATSTPVITEIMPLKGSTDGGYYVTIYGDDFEDDAIVYIDSVAVPVSDTYVGLNGDYVTIKMPASIKDLVEDYGVDQMTVPVVVLNADGGNAYRVDGFTYIIPQSEPSVTTIMPDSGSSNGGEIVEIIGYEFRFYEPFVNSVGGASYDSGDSFEDLNDNNIWDNLLDDSTSLSEKINAGLITEVKELTNDAYDYYYTSDLLPKVYFGENEAHVVEFSKGYLKVITPEHAKGDVSVYVINNDSGVSNTRTYTYEASSPKITRVTPDFGKRSGGEPKDIYGSTFYPSILYGYSGDDATSVQYLENVEALVRFGSIDNMDSERTDDDYGLVNNKRSTVNLTGGLTVTYNGYDEVDGETATTITVQLRENNTAYKRTFIYDDSEVYIPTGMLLNNAGEYYVPFGLSDTDGAEYSGNAYEYIRIYIEDRRLVVARGYSPEVIYDNDTHVKVYTPPYYTIDTVPLTYTNKDGGSVSFAFTYTNPDSEPKIYDIQPKTLNYEETAYYTEASYDGGIDIEITVLDVRPNPTVFIGDYEAPVKEHTETVINGVTYDLLVVTVPTASVNDVELEYPIVIQNEDMGLATSDNLVDLIGPNYNDETIPYYFIYKKPLSGPRISTVTPEKTSIAGGNTVVITGSDFREGAYVVIGTRAGIPIYDAEITEEGTVITFTTPEDMTLGIKTIQVINTDYGTAVAEDALTIVSAPTLDGYVYDADGNKINRIHVTGGQEIMLKGTGFAENARVYFGGESLVVEDDSNAVESDIGIYRDDTRYYVSNGYEGTNVTVVDDETILVTTPEVTFEGDIQIVVLNADGGITSNDTDVEYTVPIPDDPTGLKVKVINDQYIELYDYTSENAEYFEIYVYMGLKSESQLTSSGYRDFQYLGITDVEPYKISELPGWDKLGTGERIVFVVKGVNKFGPSGYSNLATLYSWDIEDIETLGPEDLDGELTLPEGKNYEVLQNGGIATVNLNGLGVDSIVNIDVADMLNEDTKIKRINVPEGLVSASLSNVSVDFGDSSYLFVPVVLNSPEYKTVARYFDAYAQIVENTKMDASRSYLIPNIRGKKQIGDVYSIGFNATSNELTDAYYTLSGNLDFTIYYDDKYLTQAKESQIQMYKYNSGKGSYEVYTAILDTAGNKVTARISGAGHYVLMTNY